MLSIDLSITDYRSLGIEAYRDNIPYFFAVFSALLVNFYFSYILKLALKTKIKLLTYVGTFVFYLVLLSIPIFIVPAYVNFCATFNMMFPSTFKNLLALSMYPFAIFTYVLSLTIFSPLVTDQVTEALNNKVAAIRLRIMPYLYIAMIVAYFLMILFAPFQCLIYTAGK